MNNDIKTNSPKALLLACRPQTLGAMTCPVLMGSALALSSPGFSVNIFFVTLFTALMIQILANLVNDYGDFIRGGDGKNRLGPPRAMQQGWLSKKIMLSAIAVLLLAIAVGGLILVVHAGWLVFWVGLLSVLVAIWYTAGPRPLAYLGFSELAVLIFFGPVPVLGAYFVQTASLSPSVLMASLSPALLSTALLLTNNLRDLDEDCQSGKKTLAVRLGDSFCRRAIMVCVMLAALAPLVLVAFYGASWPVLLAVLALVLPARKLSIIWQEPRSARYNLVLKAIGQSLYLFGIGFSLGVIYGAP